MSGAKQSPRATRRRAAVTDAMNGDLVRAAAYRLQRETVGRYSTTVPPLFVENTDVEPGDEGTVYVDLENECLVISYGDE